MEGSTDSVDGATTADGSVEIPAEINSNITEEIKHETDATPTLGTKQEDTVKVVNEEVKIDLEQPPKMLSETEVTTPNIEAPVASTEAERTGPLIEEFSSVDFVEGETIDDGSSHPIIEEPKEEPPKNLEVPSVGLTEDVMQIEEVQEEHEIVPEETNTNDASSIQSETGDVQEVHLQVEESSLLSSESSMEGEMILEETTGEYILASSIKKAKTEEPDTSELKKPKVETEDKAVAKMIEDKIKSGELQPGEQFVILTSDDKGNTKEVVHVVDETGEVYFIETVGSEEEGETDNTTTKSPKVPKKRSGPKKLQIPNHVLGRNIVNPADDSFRNGKAPPKPRLGVKVPYRNLTSQIVSKQEIAEEILERSRRFSRDNTRGQNLFAKKITQTLAKKLAPKEKKVISAVGTRPRGRPAFSRLNSAVKKESDKLDNSDLIAILEGDGDPEPEKDSHEEKEMTAEREREIALKQLSELPEDPPQVPKKKEVGRQHEARILKREDSAKSRFSGNTPLKTYTRKRKISEELLQQINPKPIVSPQEDPSPNPEQTTVKSPKTPTEATNTYVTKSSRIIKRKVIWDPDEASAKKNLKPEEKKAESKREVKPVIKRIELAKKSPNTTNKPKVANKDDEDDMETEDDEPQEEENVKDESDTEKDKLAVPKIKRRLNEVSKLLMDEGAVNMLYSIKSEDMPTKKTRNKSLQSKTDEIMSDLNDLRNVADRASPKALRKKDAAASPMPIIRPLKKIMCPPTPNPISRQKSKDSNRSSVHSPPPSPGHAFSGSESRIIRRHSSSSYSSMGEEDDHDDRKVKKSERRSSRRTENVPCVSEPSKKLKLEVKPSAKLNNDHFEKLVDIKLNPSEKYNKYKSFDVNELNKFIQIDLGVTAEDDNNVYLTNEVMHEIVALLEEIEADKNVNVVVITSNGPSFCNGLNFKTLTNPKEAARKSAAKKLANSIKEFLLCLAKFPKVLVAGIHGDCNGLGVTMLPLFDMIIVDQKATFLIPNAKLGCIAEGGSLLLLPHLSQNVLVNELLYSSETLTACDALKLGLATKMLPSETYAKELFSTVKGVSDKSAQFMVATKKQLRKRMIPDILSSLTDETENLVEQWTSSECQKNFSEYYSD